MVARESIPKFSADLRELSRKLELDMSTVVKKVVQDTLSAVSKRSPVKTGRFRAAWGVSQGSIPNDLGPPAGQASYNVDAEQASRFKATFEEPFKIYYVYNNLKYAQPLEAGHSQQAPSGILDLALAEVESEIDTILESVLD